MFTRKENRGGSRPGAGRKKSADPKVRIRINVEQSILDAIGGEEEAATEVYNFLKNRAIKLSKTKGI